MAVVNFNQVSRQLRKIDFIMPPAKQKVLRKICKKACQILGEVINHSTDIKAAFFAATHNKEDAIWGKSLGILAMLTDRFVYITITEEQDKMMTYGFPYESSSKYSFSENKARNGMAALNFNDEEQNFAFVAYNGIVPIRFITELGKIDMEYNPQNYSDFRKFIKGI